MRAFRYSSGTDLEALDTQLVLWLNQIANEQNAVKAVAQFFLIGCCFGLWAFCCLYSLIVLSPKRSGMFFWAVYRHPHYRSVVSSSTQTTFCTDASMPNFGSDSCLRKLWHWIFLTVQSRGQRNELGNRGVAFVATPVSVGCANPYFWYVCWVVTTICRRSLSIRYIGRMGCGSDHRHCGGSHCQMER